MNQMIHETSSFVVLQIYVCSVLVHCGAVAALVGEKTLNVRGAYFPLWFGLFVHLADVQDLTLPPFPSSITNILAFVPHDKLHIAFFQFFYGMLNK